MCFKKRVKPENKLETNTYNSEAREKIIQECVKSGIGGNHYNKLDCIPKIIYIEAEDYKPARNGFLPAYKVGFSYHGKNNTIIHYYDSPSFLDMVVVHEWMDQIDRNIAETEAFFPFAYWQVTYGRNSWHNTVYTANSESALESICDGLYKWIADIRTNTFVRFNVEDIYSITEYKVETIDDIPFWSHRMEEFGKVRIPLRGATRLE